MVERRTRRTQAERRALAEERVLEAAVVWIAAHGSSSLTLAGVGEAAGYSRGIVTHHFGSRDALLRRVIEDTRQFEEPVYEGNGLRQLAATVEAYLRNIGSRRPAGRAFLRMWSEAVASDPSLQPLFAEQDASLRTRIAVVLHSGVADGSVRADVEVDEGAVFVAACLRGTGMQLISTPPVGPLASVVAASVTLISSAFAAT